MKIRNGFVSNSSSSSFVVKKKEMSFQKDKADTILLTDGQEKALQKFGFRKGYAHSPYQVPSCEKDWNVLEKKFKKGFSKKTTKQDYAWGKRVSMDKKAVDKMNEDSRLDYSWCYDITCNQGDVIKFLIENKIAFVANVHYEHETYFYMPQSDSLVIAQNYGNRFMMYSHRMAEGKNITDEQLGKPVKFLKASEYVKTL